MRATFIRLVFQVQVHARGFAPHLVHTGEHAHRDVEQQSTKTEIRMMQDKGARSRCSGGPCESATTFNTHPAASSHSRSGEHARPRQLPASTMTTTTTSWLLMIICCVAQALRTTEGFFIDEHQSPHTSEWTYGDQANWGQVSRQCLARAQSPIDIQRKNVITNQHLRLMFYNYNKPLKFKLSNAHHTIKMNPTGLPAYDHERYHGGGGPMRFNHSGVSRDITTADEYVEFSSGTPHGDNEQLSKLQVRGPATTGHNKKPGVGHSGEREREHDGIGLEGGNSLLLEGSSQNIDENPSSREPYEGAPTIKLDWLDDGNNEYKLRDIHFHWGERRDNGSEHAIDGRRAAMEMHLVHIKHGLDKSKVGYTSDSVSVIAILIESHRKSNADFNPIVNELSRINSTAQAQDIDYKSIYDLLPSNLEAFYTYSGSLTTPPCYQVVNWIVMAERLNMNAKQIEMFRNLYAPPPGAHEDPSYPRGNKLGSGGHHDTDADEEDRRGAHHDDPELIMPNIRSLQPLNNRTILASFVKSGTRLEAASANIYAVTGSACGLQVYHISTLMVMWFIVATMART